MFHTDGHRQTEFWGRVLAFGKTLQITFKVFFQFDGVNAKIAQRLINKLVLMTVMTFLTNKAPDLFL